MTTFQRTTSNTMQNSIPRFIRDDENFAQFQNFVNSYFKSLETTNSPNRVLLDANSQLDISTMDDDNLIRNFKLLCPDLPISVLADKRLLIKNITELYSKKGTPDSFKILFRILFNVGVEITSNIDYMLKPSAGKWVVPTSIRVYISASHNPIDIIGLSDINIQTKNQYGIIKNIIQYVSAVDSAPNTYELFIDRHKNTSFLVGDVITIGTTGFTGVIVPVLSTYKIKKSGKGFKAGQIIPISDGTTATPTYIKIKSVTSTGGIKNISYIKFGTGNTSTCIIDISPITKSSNISTNIEVEYGKLGISDSTFGFIETGNIFKSGGNSKEVDYFLTNDYVESDYYGSVVAVFDTFTPPSEILNIADNLVIQDGTQGFSETITFEMGGKTFTYDGKHPILSDSDTATSSFTKYDKLSDKVATIQFAISAVMQYPGHWLDNSGFLSDPMICLQDNNIYQNHSYVVNSPIDRTDYYDVVKKLVHPVGKKMISKFESDDYFDVGAFFANNTGNDYKVFFKDKTGIVDSHSFDISHYEESSINAVENTGDTSDIYSVNYAIEGYFEDREIIIDFSTIKEDIGVSVDDSIGKDILPMVNDSTTATSIFGKSSYLSLDESSVVTDTTSISSQIFAEDYVDLANSYSAGYAEPGYFIEDGIYHNNIYSLHYAVDGYFQDDEITFTLN